MNIKIQGREKSELDISDSIVKNVTVNLVNMVKCLLKGEIQMAKKSEMIEFKTTPEIKQALEKIAENEDRTISYIINRILEEYLKIEK